MEKAEAMRTDSVWTAWKEMTAERAGSEPYHMVSQEQPGLHEVL